jgi:two-component system, NarL family, nitrate/nitrite response regulator NarL
VASSTIYLCENQPVMIEGFRKILEPCPDLKLIGDAPELELALAQVEGSNCDILLLGQPFTAKSMIPLVTEARESTIEAALVLWVAEAGEMDSFRALQMGVRGIVRKTQPAAILVECLRTVAMGSVFLEKALRSPGIIGSRRNGVLRITPREREIIKSVCRGMKNKEIAEALSITPGTVKVHLMHIFEKTGVKDRFQLALQGAQFLEAADEESPRRRPTGLQLVQSSAAE